MRDARVLWNTDAGEWEVVCGEDIPKMTWNREETTWQLHLPEALPPSHFTTFPHCGLGDDAPGGLILFDPSVKKWRYAMSSTPLGWPVEDGLAVWEHEIGAWELQDPNCDEESISDGPRILWNHDQAAWTLMITGDL